MSLFGLVVVVLLILAVLYGTNYHGNVDPYAKRFISIALLVALVVILVWALVGFGGGPVVRLR